ncbi:MAG: LysE family translocator [Pseudomonadota bacterium]
MADLAQYAPYLLAGYFAFCLGLISPGPNILAIVGTSMSVSRSAGVVLASGVSTGSIVWATLAVTGVTALMAAYAPVALALKIVGGGYLFWLGTKYIRAARAGVEITAGRAIKEASLSRYYTRGLLVQMTNPKAILSWIAMVSIVSQPGAPWWVSALYIAGCSLLAFMGHIAWAVVFSTQSVVRFYDRFKKVFNSILGAAFGALGLGLILSAFKSGTKTA